MVTAGGADYHAIVPTLRAAGCVFAEDEAALLIDAARSPAELAAMVRQRVTGVPLEYIVGWVEFCGRRVGIAPGVFVPRRRTESIVHEAIDWLDRAFGASEENPVVVVDLCCGCGAIGAAIATARPRCELHSVDIEPRAVDCARRNLSPLGGQVYVGDLFQPLAARLRGHIDLLVANAPYVPTDAIALMPPEARDHEPPVALDGGVDGLAVLRHVMDEAGDWLSPRGSVFVETSVDQAPTLIDHIGRAGLLGRSRYFQDLDATVVVATRPAGSGCSPPPSTGRS
jgi:release factor glutamine methyltransferase